MKENQKDLLMLCIATFSITYVHLWCLIFPYYSSYCYMKDNTIRVNQIYGTYLFYLFGQLFASASIPYLFKIFGISLMYLFFSLIELSMGFWGVYYIEPLQVCVVLFFKGFLYQGVQTAGNVILTEKFEGGILKGKYLNTSRLCFSFLWLFSAQFIMNPSNLPQDLKSINGEYFFHENVAKNFAFFTLLYSIASSIFLLMPFLFVTNPKNFQNQFKQFIKYLFGQSDFNFNQELTVVDSISINSSGVFIDQNQKYQSVEKSISKLTSQDKESLIEKDDFIVLENKIVHMVGIIIMLNLCITYYTVDNFKYISLVLQFKDYYITFSYFSATLFYIGSNYAVSYLWNKYGFDMSILCLNLINGVNLVAILISRNYFLFQIILARTGFGWLLLFQDLFCYSLFDAFEAMKKTKLFIFYSFLGDLIQVVLNFAIFEESHYKRIFASLFILNIISFVIHIKFLRNKIRKSNQMKILRFFLCKLLYQKYKNFFILCYIFSNIFLNFQLQLQLKFTMNIYTKIFIFNLMTLNIKACLQGDPYCARCAGSQCLKCYAAYPSSSGCASPGLEIANCLSYSSSTRCEMCNFGYRVNDQGTCEEINLEDCLQTDINKKCKMCNFSKLVKEDGTCDSSEKCELSYCDICERYMDQQRCYKCAPGLAVHSYTDSDNLYKEKCIFQNAGTQNCRRTYHNDQNTCLECEVNYYMKYGKCYINNDLKFTLNYEAFDFIVKFSSIMIYMFI